MAFAAESFDFVDVILQHRRLWSLMIAIELGHVVNLDIVLDLGGETVCRSAQSASKATQQHLLPQTGRSISIIFATLEVLKVVVPQLLVEWKIIELAAKGELPIHFFLANAKVLDVEETIEWIFSPAR